MWYDWTMRKLSHGGNLCQIGNQTGAGRNLTPKGTAEDADRGVYAYFLVREKGSLKM